MFLARLLPNFITSHTLPRLTRLKCCACHEKCSCTRLKCCACQEKCNISSDNVTSIAPPHATKCHAYRTKRSCVTLETSKNDFFCRTYQRHGHCEGCDRLRTAADRNATFGEHTSTPRLQTPRLKRDPLLRIREKS